MNSKTDYLEYIKKEALYSVSRDQTTWFFSLTIPTEVLFMLFLTSFPVCIVDVVVIFALFPSYFFKL